MRVATTWQEFEPKRPDATIKTERAEYDRAYAAAKLAADGGPEVSPTAGDATTASRLCSVRLRGG